MKIISLGVGVQSSTLYLMSSLGIVPRVDYAIFADPGAEETGTYEYLEWLKGWKEKNSGIEIIHSKIRSTIEHDLLNGTNTAGNRFASIPAFTVDEKGKKGMLRRQCTREYKVEVVDKEVRRLYGLKPHARFPETEMWMGITLDEISRAKDSREKWRKIIYPFLNMPYQFFQKEYTRGDCTSWLINNNYPVPPKSACVWCPYQGDKRLLDKKRNYPNDWERIIKVDSGIRDSSKMGVRQPIFLHRECKPIDQVNLKENQEELFDNDCGGMCGL